MPSVCAVAMTEPTLWNPNSGCSFAPYGQRREAMRASSSLIALAIVAILLASPVSYAQQSNQSAPNAQQERMKTCNTQASSQKLTGDARKSFMSECLSSETSGSGTTSGKSQQDTTRYCNFQASDRHLTGDARRSFVSDCLKGQ